MIRTFLPTPATAETADLAALKWYVPIRSDNLEPVTRILRPRLMLRKS